MGEFDLIKRYFSTQAQYNPSVQLAIGDDCALVSVPEAAQLAITTDTMVENTHFLPTISPADLAYKAIATNLSDLAAMGAKPQWISLALTLPHIDEIWLGEFSQSFLQTLNHYNVTLIGGDTTKGHLSITITAQGFIPQGKALCRHQAQIGDLIYVSGSIGDSAAGLAMMLAGKSAVNSAEDFLIQRHLRPTPRVSLGQALAGITHSAIDISDGLVADLGHILERSQCCAEIDLERLPLSEPLIAYCGKEKAEIFALSGGEDYELCFTAPADAQHKIVAIAQALSVPCTCIGRIVEAKGGQFKVHFLRNGKPVEMDLKGGFEHF